jgi:hypothetical protein
MGDIRLMRSLIEPWQEAILRGDAMTVVADLQAAPWNGRQSSRRTAPLKDTLATMITAGSND